jgi:MFS family permease
MTDNGNRRRRAVLRNAVAWGVAWALAGGALVTVLGLFEADPRIDSLAERLGFSVLAGILWGVRFGVIGAVIGTLFSFVVRAGYRGRRLADIDPVRFGILGAVVGGLGVPLVLQTMNVLTGGAPIAWGLVADDGVWAALFGAVAAAGSILLARRADALPHDAAPEPLDRANDLDALPAALGPEVAVPQRARSARG